MVGVIHSSILISYNSDTVSALCIYKHINIIAITADMEGDKYFVYAGKIYSRGDVGNSASSDNSTSTIVYDSSSSSGTLSPSSQGKESKLVLVVCIISIAYLAIRFVINQQQKQSKE